MLSEFANGLVILAAEDRQNPGAPPRSVARFGTIQTGSTFRTPFAAMVIIEAGATPRIGRNDIRAGVIGPLRNTSLGPGAEDRVRSRFPGLISPCPCRPR